MSGAVDVTGLLTAVGGEQMHYIEFSGVRRELQAQQRWPLLRLVSEQLDEQVRPTDIVNPVVLHKDGAAP